MGYYARYLFPLSPFHKTRDTPRRVKQGGSKKSFLLRRSEKTATKRKNGKRVLGLITDEGGSAFLAKGVAKMRGCQAAKKKKTGQIFQKLDARYFCQRKLF